MRTAIVCAGTAMNWGAALLPKFTDHLAPTERSAGFGLIRTAYTMLGAGGSVVTGPAADLSRWAILGLTVLQGGMLLVCCTPLPIQGVLTQTRSLS